MRSRPARVRTARLGGPDVTGDVVWLNNRRLAFLPSTGAYRGTDPPGDVARVFDDELRLRGQLTGWAARLPVRLPNQVFGVRTHRLEAAG